MLSAYIISGIFLSCFDFSSLSILQAFMVAEELNLKVNIPEGLQKFLDLDENKKDNQRQEIYKSQQDQQVVKYENDKNPN
jgi:hypothetical protein